MKGRGLEVLEGGMILDVSPAKIPRIIGRRGSMINMINDHLRIDSVVGQNGRIWIKTSDVHKLRLAIKAFKMIEAQAHTSNLTDRINKMLSEALAELDDSEPIEEKSTEVEVAEEPVEDESVEEPEVAEVPEPEPVVEVEGETKPEPEPEPEATEKEETEEKPVEENIEPEASTGEEIDLIDDPKTEEVKE
jgi:exosome complex component RRP4